MRTHRPKRLAQVAGVGLAGLIAYALLAYVLLPMAWRHYERQPRLEGRPMVTRTASGIPGDPLNIGLVGDRDDVSSAMQAIGWSRAKPVSLRSSIGIAGSVLLNRSDPKAPVSALFYDGRREDLAFERAYGPSARQRHHVRFWKVLDVGAEGRPVWLGSATFDHSVGLSARTGQVTHHISPDVDDERDLLSNAMLSKRRATSAYQISGVGPTLDGRNGGGDRYFTDGEIEMLVLTKGGRPSQASPVRPPSPLRIQAKDRVWAALEPVLRRSVR